MSYPYAIVSLSTKGKPMNFTNALTNLSIVFPPCNYCGAPGTYKVSEQLGFCNDCNPFCTDCHNIDCDCTCGQ
jgi:hypothetical protein